MPPKAGTNFPGRLRGHNGADQPLPLSRGSPEPFLLLPPPNPSAPLGVSQVRTSQAANIRVPFRGPDVRGLPPRPIQSEGRNDSGGRKKLTLHLPVPSPLHSSEHVVWLPHGCALYATVHINSIINQSIVIF